MMANRCVVVIGHVDHGKTALVRALTGTDTDRLPEEKARGLSIAPGFAHLQGSHGTLDLIDAPGHEDFIHAMIAGSCGASAALIAISAVEGSAAQTAEHLAIAGLLGITDGVIAVTKCDALPPEDQAMRLAEIKQSLAQTAFQDAPMVLCSAQSGAGIEHLGNSLNHLLTLPVPTAPLVSFLPIDRVFSVAGRGTIVTGTLQGRPLAVDDTLMLMPAQRPVPVRGLQRHGQDLKSVQPGTRVAANLRGVGVTDIKRGDVLVGSNNASVTQCLDVRLDPLPAHHFKHMQDLRLFLGTANAVAQLRLYRRAPDQQAHYAQLRVKAPLCAFEGQRGILRDLSPAATLGGFTVLDAQANPVRRGDQARMALLKACDHRSAPDVAGALALSAGGVAPLAKVARLVRQTPDDVIHALAATFQDIGNGAMCSRADIERAETAFLAKLANYHAAHPLRATTPPDAVRNPKHATALRQYLETTLVSRGSIVYSKDGFALTNHNPLEQMTEAQQERMATLDHLFETAALTTHALTTGAQDAMDGDLIALLEATNRLIRLQNIGLSQTVMLHCTAVDTAADKLRDAFPHPLPFTTGAARDALGTSRKVIVPLLEYFDAHTITTRTGNTRKMRA